MTLNFMIHNEPLQFHIINMNHMIRQFITFSFLFLTFMSPISIKYKSYRLKLLNQKKLKEHL